MTALLVTGSGHGVGTTTVTAALAALACYPQALPPAAAARAGLCAALGGTFDPAAFRRTSTGER